MNKINRMISKQSTNPVNPGNPVQKPPASQPCSPPNELSHAGPRTQPNPRLPGKTEMLPGVGCSDFVSSECHQESSSEKPFPPCVNASYCRVLRQTVRQTL